MSEPGPERWLPPRAPGAGDTPRWDAPGWQPAHPAPSPEPPAGSTPAAEPAGAADGGQPPGSGPTFVRPGAQAGSNPRATTALVLGIVGLGLLVLSLGTLFLITIPCSIGAWVLGIQGRRLVDRGVLAGQRAQARAGVWLGAGGVGLGIVAMVVWIALIASGFSVEDFQQDLERELERSRDPQT